MKTQKILLIVLFSVVAAIILVTAIAFTTGNARLGYGLRKTSERSLAPARDDNVTGVATNDEAPLFENENKYWTLGQLRSRTAPEKKDGRGAIVVVNGYLEIEKNDAEFTEELSAKFLSVKSTILTYFPRHSERELLLMGEEKVKEEILTEINNNLVLGKVKNIYFDEYQFFN